MKYRWLKVSPGGLVWGTNDLKSDDLLRRRDGLYEAIIDIAKMTVYDPVKNEWLEIQGDTD